MLTIAEVLSAEDARRVCVGLASVPFKDGKATAGHAARKVKQNAQAQADDEKALALAAFVRQAIDRSHLFQAYVRPARFSKFLFSRYVPGDAYGLHVDDPMMGAEAERIRTDLSFTLFLAEPDTYDGGELLIDGLDGEREVKLPAGAMVVYPTGALHRVNPVSSGERIACVGWVQSLIRRADEREILFDLARARAGLADGEARLLIDKSVGNLTRLWGEP